MNLRHGSSDTAALMVTAHLVDCRFGTVTQPDRSGTKRKGSARASNPKASKSLAAELKQKGDNLLARVNDVDVAKLSNPAMWIKLPFPSISGTLPADRFALDDNDAFDFMGRLAVTSVLNEIERRDRRPTINVYGTKGYGKSHILAAAVVQLIQIPENRVVFLPHARDLAKTPKTYLQDALALAFGRDADAIGRIADCDSVQSLLDVCATLSSFILVVDQMNSLEEDSKLWEASKVQAHDIVKTLCDSRNCTVAVKGFSANNQTMIAYYETQKSERSLAMFGGFEDVEYTHWLDHQVGVLGGTGTDKAKDLRRDADMISTQLGRVPMYLAALMARVCGGTIMQSDGTEREMGPMSVKQAFRDTSLALSARVQQHLNEFFDDPPRGVTQSMALGVAQCALQGSTSGKPHKYWDHRYIFTLDGCLKTVCFIVNDVLASILRERTDADGLAAILSEANIAACIKCANPTEQGCRAEEIAITAICRAWIPHELFMGEDSTQKPQRVSTTHFNKVTDAVLLSGDAAVHYVPRAFNYEHVDSVLRVLTFGKGKKVDRVDVFAFQFTRQSYAAHKHSLDFFKGDHSAWVTDLDEVPVRWHFVWVLTSKECVKHLSECSAKLSGRGTRRRAARSGDPSMAHPAFTEWFFSFSDFVPKLTI